MSRRPEILAQLAAAGGGDGGGGGGGNVTLQSVGEGRVGGVNATDLAGVRAGAAREGEGGGRLLVGVVGGGCRSGRSNASDSDATRTNTAADVSASRAASPGSRKSTCALGDGKDVQTVGGEKGKKGKEPQAGGGGAQEKKEAGGGGVTLWRGLGLDERICAALLALGFHTPTPIQV